jgi:hypothetical protein
VLAGALADAAARHPDWHVVRHEDACVDPLTKVAALTSALGLEFSDAAATYLRESNQPGSRYVTRRVTDDLADKWREILTLEEIDTALTMLDLFPPHLGLVERVGL